MSARLKTYGIAVLSVYLTITAAYGQHGYDLPLKKKLKQMGADDQRYRELMVIQPGEARDSIAKKLGISSDDVNQYYCRIQHVLDSTNLVMMEAIFNQHGYPGKSMVGEPENEVAYYVIQHSDKIEKYFPLIEQAGAKGDLSFVLVAMMLDRLLKNRGEEQLYATQYAGIAVKDSATNEQKIEWFLWPVKDAAHVADRRKKAGFKETIAEDAASQGIAPKVVTIEEARKKYPGFFPAKK